MGNMTAQGRELPRGATFEEVWAMFQENERRMRETERFLKELDAETDRQMQETARRMQETDRQMQETDRQMQETARRMKETDQKIGKLTGRLGDVIEHLMSPKLHEKFKALNFVFSRTSRNVEIRDHNQRGLAEVDALLENGEYVMAVEVKTRLTTEDVNDHLRRMEVLRRVADERDDRRKYLGAVAGAVVDKNVADYALKNGFYVIVPSGETVDIEAPEPSNLRMW
ncbi:MAG: hypothetical protein LBF60_03390 [Treponema sp.]|jgi:septal ring factor EnvC (AmiA/AmiB activator)|nr:hypothetical protein [Treponema sp.]